jgi:segregation and condensation protein B
MRQHPDNSAESFDETRAVPAPLDGDEGDSLLLDPTQFEDLDALYRQALAAMEAVDAGCEAAGRMLAEPRPPTAADAAAGPTSDVQPARGPVGVALQSDAAPPPEAPVTPAQIVEAVLFVGGSPITSKKLCSLLRDSFDQSYVENLVDELNARYSRENRPYTIEFGEGGFRLALKPEFESVRRRVYGLGPREVKLTHDALELLALVAYRQPISRQEIQEIGKPNSAVLLRQLLRRELIALERGASGPDDVAYRTTPRFLQLFGIGTAAELPRADELTLK